MAVRDILLLGNPRLYRVSPPVKRSDRSRLARVVPDLHDTLMNFRRRYGAGRAIAAPQIGVPWQLIYLNVREPVVFVNPVLDRKSKERIEVWDDCMCFPDLLVKVKRHRGCRIRYLDMGWVEREMWLEGDLSELLQHECDHLDGVLAVSRAVDGKSFALRTQKNATLRR